jgi:hypothetical protein
MNLIRLTAVSVLVFAASAYGQQIQWVDPSAPKLAPSSAEAATRSECLQLGTNTEIHRCAEKYRAHGGGKIVKTGQKTGKAKGGDTTKDLNPSKAAGTPPAPSSHAADAAKTADAGAAASASPAAMKATK